MMKTQLCDGHYLSAYNDAVERFIHPDGELPNSPVMIAMGLVTPTTNDDEDA